MDFCDTVTKTHFSLIFRCCFFSKLRSQGYMILPKQDRLKRCTIIISWKSQRLTGMSGGSGQKHKERCDHPRKNTVGGSNFVTFRLSISLTAIHLFGHMHEADDPNFPQTRNKVIKTFLSLPFIYKNLNVDNS